MQPHCTPEKFMPSRIALVLALSLVLLQGANAAAVPPPALPPVTNFPVNAGSALHIDRETDPSRPFSVVGPRGALLGQEDGVSEAWIFPWKIFSDLRIVARMQDYDVPIEVNPHAAEMHITPNATILTYAHANFTIRQIMFAPKTAPHGAGAVILFQIQAIRPMTLTFSFRPVMQRMWPAASDPDPSPEWVPTAKSAESSSGFYILHEDFPGQAAALAMPTAEAGILAPYQERAHYYPLQFVLHFDPRRDQGRFFPLLMVLGDTPQTATRDALAQSLAALDASVTDLYEKNAAYYQALVETHTSIATPDKRLNEAFSWAIAAIDQLKVVTPSQKGQALTAGFVGSGDSNRPGFGWFFGRDALWTLYAVNSYGDPETARQELEFLIRRQRADGKIMHEYSQTANLVDWSSTPYEYAAADSTPLFLMAAADYLRTTGDTAFIRTNWAALDRAWTFETSHVSDDGIYNNSQGTGWVESWIPSMPHQEIYLAALDQQASTALASLARAAGHAELADQAAARATRLGQTIENEYFVPAANFYAFSRNPDGTTDNTATIFPSVAWWDGTFRLAHTEPMFQRWASSEFSTDWGTRILSDKTSFYDPISYHQGSVWPLFTGWVSVAEYRADHPLSGYVHLMQNANLTWSQDPGDTTELLSGKFFQVLGRSTAHQLWSSAMVISPIMRGLFGLEWNQPANTLTVTPHLPAEWPGATLHNVPFGNSRLDLSMQREGANLAIRIQGAPAGLRLASSTPGTRQQGDVFLIPLPPVEIGVEENLPPFGSETSQLKVLQEQYQSHALVLHLAAPAGSAVTMDVRENGPARKIAVTGATLEPAGSGLQKLQISFPSANSSSAEGYVQKPVTLRW
jgi:glycogen debranching enzyme